MVITTSLIETKSHHRQTREVTCQFNIRDIVGHKEIIDKTRFITGLELGIIFKRDIWVHREFTVSLGLLRNIIFVTPPSKGLSPVSG